MWNTPHSKTCWNLGTEDESIEYFTLNGVTCYHDLLTDKYYAFLGIAGDRKVEFETREALQKGVKVNDNGQYTETVSRLQKAW